MDDPIKVFDANTKSYITLEQLHEQIKARVELPADFDGDWDKVWERLDPMLISSCQEDEETDRGEGEDPILTSLQQRHEESYCAFKPVEYPIRLDFSSCGSLYDVHHLLKTAFGLPEYYGMNWDALWDCLDYYFVDDVGRVEFCGLGAMSKDLYEACAPMFEIFEDLRKQAPGVEFVYLS